MCIDRGQILQQPEYETRFHDDYAGRRGETGRNAIVHNARCHHLKLPELLLQVRSLMHTRTAFQPLSPAYSGPSMMHLIADYKPKSRENSAPGSLCNRSAATRLTLPSSSFPFWVTPNALTASSNLNRWVTRGLRSISPRETREMAMG